MAVREGGVSRRKRVTAIVAAAKVDDADRPFVDARHQGRRAVADCKHRRRQKDGRGAARDALGKFAEGRHIAVTGANQDQLATGGYLCGVRAGTDISCGEPLRQPIILAPQCHLPVHSRHVRRIKDVEMALFSGRCSTSLELDHELVVTRRRRLIGTFA